MKRNNFLLLIACIFGSSVLGQSHQSGIGEYPIDTTAGFKPCGVPPFGHYHFLPYNGDVRAIHLLVKQQYKNIKTDQSGYITIRGFLNCKNQMKIIKTLCVDMNYQPCLFDVDITNQLELITKQLANWQAQTYDSGEIAEGYVSVIYKIKKGGVEHVIW